MDVRARILLALAKPQMIEGEGGPSDAEFNPWEDVIQGIHGNYSSESDRLMVEAMEAVRDKITFNLIDREGFAGEFALYVLSGHGLLEYGTSPRGGWPDPSIADLWQPLIDKWREYANRQWGDGWAD